MDTRMRINLKEQAAALSARLGRDVLPTQYEIGYAMRMAGERRPHPLLASQVDVWEGWDTADRRLRWPEPAGLEA